ncbi:MAG: hypothetical protein NC517_09015 [Firmicutes bacterium]|nr:hypothetical protein [Bacillota bacterium]
MLSTRYADPFSLLDEMIQNDLLPEFIDHMIRQTDEDRLWEMYLATAVMQDKSFEDWKAGITTNRNREEQEPVTEYTPEEAVKRAEGILAGFKPF